MSYRAFKRLLGETSLERKCRFLFGAATLLLITGSFWWYAWNTETVAYEQARGMSRLLADEAVIRVLSEGDVDAANRTSIMNLRRSLARNELQFEEEIITWNTTNPQYRDLLVRFQADGISESEEHLADRQDRNYVYRMAIWNGTEPGTIRLTGRTIHADWPEAEQVEPGQLLGIVTIEMNTQAIQSRMHINRALLIVTALVTATLLMAGSWLIVRYVIVKPVKHLKDVSDAITAGELNIRSEIQTGDEFEDLSHAFNRMLRTLVSMQDQLRRVNRDLDHKVDELAQANMALYQTNQLKSDFLATMSHELRTPLNSILGFSEVLLSSPGLNDKQKKWVKNIRTSGEHLLAMINDVLDLAKVEAGKMEVRAEDFSIHDTAEGLMNMFRPMAEKKNIQLECRIDPGIPPLKQDSSKLRQILSNLLSNAIKFTPEGGKVTLKAETDGVHLVLSVIDTGVGIAEEDQELIFDKFRQGTTALTREHTGTGLGLSIVRELSKLLGGDVGLHSELGRGSTFVVTLPLRLHVDARPEFELADGAPRLPVV